MRDWKYDTKTESAVRDALLRLLTNKRLADITVSELAREAHVSRRRLRAACSLLS